MLPLAATVTVVPLRLKPDALPDHEADELTSTLRYSVVVPVVMPFHFVYFGRLCDAVALRRLVPPDEPIPDGLADTDNEPWSSCRTPLSDCRRTV